MSRGAQVLHRQGPTPLHARRPYPRARRAGSPEARPPGGPTAPRRPFRGGAGGRRAARPGPVDFGRFLLSLGAQAGMLLAGPVEGLGPAEALEEARSVIGVLEMLKDKTEGRRTPHEDAGPGRPPLRAADGLRGPRAGGRRVRRAARAASLALAAALSLHSPRARRRRPKGRRRPGPARPRCDPGFGQLRGALRGLRQGRTGGRRRGGPARVSGDPAPAHRAQRAEPRRDRASPSWPRASRSSTRASATTRRSCSRAPRASRRACPTRTSGWPWPSSRGAARVRARPRRARSRRFLALAPHRPRPLPRPDPARAGAPPGGLRRRPRSSRPLMLLRLGPLLRHDLEEALGSGTEPERGSRPSPAPAAAARGDVPGLGLALPLVAGPALRVHEPRARRRRRSLLLLGILAVGPLLQTARGPDGGGAKPALLGERRRGRGRGRQPRATAELERAAKADSGRPRPRLSARGAATPKAGRYDDAAAVYREVLRAAPDDADRAQQPRQPRVRPRRVPGGHRPLQGRAPRRPPTASRRPSTSTTSRSPTCRSSRCSRPTRRSRRRGGSSGGLISTFDRLWKYDKGDYAVVDMGLSTEDVEQKFLGLRRGHRPRRTCSARGGRPSGRLAAARACSTGSPGSSPWPPWPSRGSRSGAGARRSPCAA